ncbi:retinoblastoma-binding protein 5 [Caerostris extrusa]|uniref:Retinoblastoma-binding protein 5 n=1 Tax=Caerostris extrusa TaxID=172846 RepID=A0AAV4XV57_CAEEX|nr:retinoblastoma-binding protein 5 [Caerostris extrusa]
MILENAPKDEIHPLLSTKTKDKVNQQVKKTGKSRQHRGSSHSESKTTHRSKYNKKDKVSVDYYGWKDVD